jgi:hypothetical protein
MFGFTEVIEILNRQKVVMGAQAYREGSVSNNGFTYRNILLSFIKSKIRADEN